MSSSSPTVVENPQHARRWLILALIGIAQLMVVLDATIVNIALPSAQRALGFSNDSRQWVVTAYALSFGSLLLIGGRIGDLFGRKRVFVAGLLGFAIASAAGGAAQSFGMLVAARALQGGFGALLAPAALSLLTTTFLDPGERARAFGIFGAIAGSGAALGLLLGGMLTQWLSWRWCLYVNLLFAVPAAFASLSLLHDPARPDRPRVDLLGTVTSGAGLFALVFGLTKAETDGWGAGVTIGFLAAAVVLLSVFVVLQSRTANPLLPLRVIKDRDRGGSYLAIGVTGTGMFGVFLFLTYYLQQNLGFSPIGSGLAFLPLSFAIIVSATMATARLMPRFGHRPLVTIGMGLAAIGMAYLAQLDTSSTYAPDILPALLVMGVGLGLVFAPAMATATFGVAPHDAGVASALVNTMQQVGGSVGTALLSTLSASAVGSYVATHGAQSASAAAVHGYTVAFWWAAGIFAVGAVAVGFLMRSGVRVADASAEPVMAH
ncbi:MAG TPA: MFS transporter [Conexibacter sp.]|jgi:EmrB/QacA subfamily drug resistance transporter